MDNSLYVKLFEYGTYVEFLIAVVLMFTIFKKHRVLQWISLTALLSFPMEWFIDNFILFMHYDEKFTPMFGHFPLFLPFAWAWFFPLVIGVLMTQEQRLRKLPPVMYYLVVFLIWVVWDFFVEAIACHFDLWVYWHPRESLIPGTKLLKSVPLAVAAWSMFMYLLCVWAKKRYESDPQVGWWRGFGALFGRYVAIAVMCLTLASIRTHVILGYDPTPYAPQWWIDSVRSGKLPF